MCEITKKQLMDIKSLLDLAKQINYDDLQDYLDSESKRLDARIYSTSRGIAKNCCNSIQETFSGMGVRKNKSYYLEGIQKQRDSLHDLQLLVIKLFPLLKMGWPKVIPADTIKAIKELP